MSTINNTDTFLVYRGNTSYKVTAANLMSTLQDADLLLINRGSASYKITGADLKSQLGNVIDTANSDTSQNWNTYWYTSYHSGSWSLANRRSLRSSQMDWHPLTNVFDGFHDPGSGTINYRNIKPFWIPPNGLSFTSFEIGYSVTSSGSGYLMIEFDNGVTFRARKNTNGAGTHTFDQNDITGLSSSPSIKHIFMDDPQVNYEPHRIIDANDNWFSWDYIKVNGKYLVDPKALNPAISPT